MTPFVVSYKPHINSRMLQGGGGGGGGWDVDTTGATDQRSETPTGAGYLYLADREWEQLATAQRMQYQSRSRQI